MGTQSYKFAITHAHAISGWTILSKLLHAQSPYIGVLNGTVRSELYTLAFKKRYQLEGFLISIPRHQK